MQVGSQGKDLVLVDDPRNTKHPSFGMSFARWRLTERRNLNFGRVGKAL